MDPNRLLPATDPSPLADDSAELELLVRRSDEDVALFDSQRIVEALVREAQVDAERARQISQEIKRFIERVGLRTLSSSLIRGLVDAKLLEYGLEDAHRAHSRLGVPLYDVDRLMLNGRRNASGLPHGPEGTSLALAEAIKREYAIASVFSEPTANAHLVGDIHIQDLGAVDRPYSLTSSVDFVKQHGVALPQGFASTAPARRPEVLVAHLVKFSAALQGYLSGPVVWDSLNFALAPYVEAIDERDLKQLAQTLLFEFSAPAVARAGQPIVCDAHLDWEAPVYMRSRQAIGPGGVAVNRTYAEYTETAHRLLRALFDAYLAGDARGRPFLSPRPILHITKHFNEQPGYRGLLDLASRVAAERGLTFVFDRDDSASFFNRYGLVDDRAVETSASSEWRSAALQVVALNLPRVAFLAAGDQVRVFEELTRLMEAAAQAHLEKRVFLEKLLAQGEQGPLSVIALRVGSKPFLRLSWMTHWISPIGLAEMTRAVLGVESYEDDGAREFAARVVSHLRREAERLSNKHKVRFVLAETASYSVAHRLAGLDVRFFGKAAVDVMRGSPDTGAGYYTTGAKVPAGADVSPLERVRVEGTFHQHGILDAASDLWLGGKVPTPEQIAIAVSQAFYQSTTSSLVIAPTFTTCLDCGAISHGLSADCATCGSTRVDGLVGGAGSSTNTSSWDAGRQAELADRRLLGE